MVEVDAPRAPVRLPREIWVLVGASFLIAIGFGLVAPTLPVFVRSFDVGIAAAGLVISVFALARLVFAPSSGWLVGRLGELRVFNAGLLIVAVSTAAMAFAGEYWHLLALRAFGGIGSTMFTISAVSLLIRLSPPEIRGRASGMWATGFLLGNIAGPLVGGGLVTVSLRAPFLVYAVMLVVATVFTGLLLRGRTRETLAEGELPAPTMTFGSALRHRAYRAALVAGFANGWAVFGVRVALIPLFVVEALGQDEAFAGVALGVFAVGNAITLVGAGRLADRIGRRPPILVGLGVSAAGTAVVGFVENVPLFLAVSLLAGLGSGLLNPPLNAAVADVVGNRARGGPVLAGFQMSADIGAITGPALAGLLAQLTGYATAFALTGAIAAVAMLVWLRAPETLPGKESHAGADAVADCAGCDDGPPVPGPVSRPR